MWSPSAVDLGELFSFADLLIDPEFGRAGMPCCFRKGMLCRSGKPIRPKKASTNSHRYQKQLSSHPFRRDMRRTRSVAPATRRRDLWLAPAAILTGLTRCDRFAFFPRLQDDLPCGDCGLRFNIFSR